MHSLQRNDADMFEGVNYKVKYLGSVEVDFDSAATGANNQEHSQKAMRAILAHSKEIQKKQAIPKMVLTVSVGNLKLTTLDGTKTVMRHATTRVAYSTVDAENPKLFAYVGMVKTSGRRTQLGYR